MTNNQQKAVDALKRFPAQKNATVKISFTKNGAYIESDLLTDAQETEVMRHLSDKQKLLK